MEKSIKRVEKLVHATSSTLAQMKFSLMFDDMNGGKNYQSERKAEDLDAAILEKFLKSSDLNLQQNEFKLKASEALAKMDKILTPNEFSRKKVKPLDRIKEINKKLNYLMLEQSKRGETKQSRQKLLSLINEEKFSPRKTPCKESVECDPPGRLNEEKETSEKNHLLSQKTESVLTATKSPVIPKTELKNKILETQEIVNRGFQTARQLAQKVETITKWDKKDRTPNSSGKTVSEITLRSLEGKTESNETIKTAKCRRCSKKKKNNETEPQDGKRINSRVIDIKRNDFKRDTRSNLQLQHLPSLHIKGGLKVQKIHNLEIPASEELLPEKTNTAISFLSHEQIERENLEKALNKIRKEYCDCIEEVDRKKYVECFNCGKLIRIRETWVDPRRIDEILQKCDFNVFDPKIDEFLEKIGGPGVVNQCKESRPTATIRSHSDVIDELHPLKPNEENKRKENQNKIKEEPKNTKRFTLQDFSDQLCKKYKEEADALADYHLKLDAVLGNLFRKVEESKDVFKTSQLLRNFKSDSERAPVLTKTKPVLITLPRASLSGRNKRKKLDKKDVKNRSKSRTEFFVDNKFILPMPPHSESSEVTEGEGISPLIHSSWKKNCPTETKEKVQRRHFASVTRKSEITNQMYKKEAEELNILTSPLSHSGSTFKEKKINKTVVSYDCELKENTKPQENKSLVGSSTSKGKSARSSNSKKTEKIEEKAGFSISSSASPRKTQATYKADFTFKNGRKSKYFLTSQTQLNSAKPINISEDMERALLVKSSNKNFNFDKDVEEKAEPCKTPSEKSENNYESDFESFTNELEEKGNEFDDKESERSLILRKLPTISEVDSELEKKFYNDQKILPVEGDKNGQCVTLKESNAEASRISSDSNNLKGTPMKTTEASPKRPPSMLVTSLKDILMAMQNEFAKTESLTEKLTENSKVEEKEITELKKAPVAESIVNSWEMTTPVKLVKDLQSSRKDWNSNLKTNFSLNLADKLMNETSRISEEISSADGTPEEGGSSLGEIILSEGRKSNSVMSSASSVSQESILNLTSEVNSLTSADQKEVISISDLNLVS